MTHDSIGLGEDGPTHQPVEHLASFRIMPNMLTMRPGDGNETAGCYYAAVQNSMSQNPKGIKRPSTLVFSRQVGGRGRRWGAPAAGRGGGSGAGQQQLQQAAAALDLQQGGETPTWCRALSAWQPTRHPLQFLPARPHVACCCRACPTWTPPPLRPP